MVSPSPKLHTKRSSSKKALLLYSSTICASGQRSSSRPLCRCVLGILIILHITTRYSTLSPCWSYYILIIFKLPPPPPSAKWGINDIWYENLFSGATKGTCHALFAFLLFSRYRSLGRHILNMCIYVCFGCFEKEGGLREKLSVENDQADAGRDDLTCLARSSSQARTGTGIFFFFPLFS